MKKNSITTLALIAAFSMVASIGEAQIVKSSDVEKSIAVVEEIDDDKEHEEFLDRAVHDQTVELAQPEKQNITIDYLAPVGSGVLLLSCLGGAYLLGKRRKE